MRGLPAAVDALTAELAASAEELAAAFGVPEEWLSDLPIARGDLVAACDDPDASWHRQPAPAS